MRRSEVHHGRHGGAPGERRPSGGDGHPGDGHPGAGRGDAAGRPGGRAGHPVAAACGYWQRRGLPTGHGQVVAAPGGPLLLLALCGALGAGGRDTPDGMPAGSVLLPRPCADWYAAPLRLLGRRVGAVPVPAECGGVPDPVVLQETVRRADADGAGRPQALLLSVADDPTGTAAPPELLHEVCEAATGAGLLILSDESWRDTAHDPHDTVLVSPAEMLGAGHADSVVVLADLSPVLPPGGPPAAVARFPATARGRALAAGVRAALEALGARLRGPAAGALTEALSEPPAHERARAAAARTDGALARALHEAVTGAGALCRPPHTGRHLYADLEPLRSALAAGGIGDAPALEAALVRRLGPRGVRGGHHFGDDPAALRFRLTTELAAGTAGWGTDGGTGGETGAPADRVYRALLDLTRTR